MRAVVADAGRLSVEEIDAPSPGAGQVLVRPIATGICGSDLHVVDVQAEDPVAHPPMVLGHEFCAEVLDHGPGTTGAPPAGTLVCSVPFVDGPLGPELVGLSANYPGGFAEHMVLQASRLLPVPEGVDAARAAVTEPLAVGVHAVRTARLARRDVALVVGCGPIGLAVVSALKADGHGPVVAADFSAARRALAEGAGADVVVDPATSSPYDTWLGLAAAPLMPSPLLDAGSPAADTVVFDCVGAPGLMEAIITAVPSHTRIVVVGVCAASDSFVPVRAIEKELTVQYVFAYRPEEFALALSLIADGTVDVGPWITGTCDLDHVGAAFTDLRAADAHCKIIVAPEPTALVRTEPIMTITPERYADKVALVTGAASGIGRATATRLVAEGAMVVGGDVNHEALDALAGHLGDHFVAQRCDVTLEVDVAALVATAVERFGGLHAAFNIAGGSRPGLIVDMTEEDWDFTVDLCLKGVFLGVKHQARQMIAQGGGGAIVNIASLNSRVPMFFGVAYSAAKAGVVMVGQNAALELGEHGIRVCTVSPGLTDTPLVAALTGDEEANAAYLERIPLKRPASPEDIASAATYLASDDASYITGVNLFVDGAWEQTAYPDLRPMLGRLLAGDGS